MTSMLSDYEVKAFREAAAAKGQRRYGGSGQAGPPGAETFEEGAIWALTRVRIAPRTVALGPGETRACANSDDPLIRQIAERAGASA
jgi:hypothetical protein